MHTLLYLTNFIYQAKGRNYYEEDLYITAQLRSHFNVLIADPQQAIALMHCANLVVFRNTGPIIYYHTYFKQFVAAVQQQNITTFNAFNGKGDMTGKQYLCDLYQAGYAVIPTITSVHQIDQLGPTEQYIVKIKDGADSIGMEIVSKAGLLLSPPVDKLIQPFVDFTYEVSFYYLNQQFEYALYAPNPAERWKLVMYQPTNNDLQFASQFINWNNLAHGITRVDACRLPDGRLLLVELEDLNPYLSIDVLPDTVRNTFIEHLITALKTLLPGSATQ